MYVLDSLHGGKQSSMVAGMTASMTVVPVSIMFSLSLSCLAVVIEALLLSDDCGTMVVEAILVVVLCIATARRVLISRNM